MFLSVSKTSVSFRGETTIFTCQRKNSVSPFSLSACHPRVVSARPIRTRARRRPDVRWKTSSRRRWHPPVYRPVIPGRISGDDDCVRFVSRLCDILLDVLVSRLVPDPRKNIPGITFLRRGRSPCPPTHPPDRPR